MYDPIISKFLYTSGIYMLSIQVMKCAMKSNQIQSNHVQ